MAVLYGNALKMLDEATTDIATRITRRSVGQPDGREAVFAGMTQSQANWDSAHDRYLDAATALVGSP